MSLHRIASQSQQAEPHHNCSLLFHPDTGRMPAVGRRRGWIKMFLWLCSAGGWSLAKYCKVVQVRLAWGCSNLSGSYVGNHWAAVSLMPSPLFCRIPSQRSRGSDPSSLHCVDIKGHFEEVWPHSTFGLDKEKRNGQTKQTCSANCDDFFYCTSMKETSTWINDENITLTWEPGTFYCQSYFSCFSVPYTFSENMSVYYLL